MEKNIKINFRVDKNLESVARYDRGFITFSDNPYISYLTLCEELAHAAQEYLIYNQEVMYTYFERYRFNLELEAHILSDAARFLKVGKYNRLDSSTVGSSGSENLDNAANMLINSIIEKGEFTKSQWELYRKVAEEWCQYTGRFNYNFEPKALYEF